jgi:hypothetical protein
LLSRVAPCLPKHPTPLWVKCNETLEINVDIAEDAIKLGKALHRKSLLIIRVRLPQLSTEQA